jgi:hypothetical protein
MNVLDMHPLEALLIGVFIVINLALVFTLVSVVRETSFSHRPSRQERRRRTLARALYNAGGQARVNRELDDWAQARRVTLAVLDFSLRLGSRRSRSFRRASER